MPSKDQVVKLCRQKGFGYNRLTYTTANRKAFLIKYSYSKMVRKWPKPMPSYSFTLASAQMLSRPFASRSSIMPESQTIALARTLRWNTSMSITCVRRRAGEDIDQPECRGAAAGRFWGLWATGWIYQALVFKDREAMKRYSDVSIT